ncbi:hypothetical protein DDE20_14800 [Pararhodobacter oceanensis]|uniref:Uncharacterized protein n=1 Tax=Pararhodobacter oceanensis TaxID=2172121 RepID=A0A2T8HRP7_9RHOB|nr:hypothetical protein DDE20_14800 [Pararhodobacter oceanensis]
MAAILRAIPGPMRQRRLAPRRRPLLMRLPRVCRVLTIWPVSCPQRKLQARRRSLPKLRLKLKLMQRL